MKPEDYKALSKTIAFTQDASFTSTVRGRSEIVFQHNDTLERF